MKAWEIVTNVLIGAGEFANPGVSTGEIDAWAEKYIVRMGGTPYNKGYQPKPTKIPFPATMCISINDEIVHGIPSKERRLQEGDLVSFDVGVKKDGLCGDAAFTMGIGRISKEDEQLLKVAKKALYRGLREVKNGKKIGNVSKAITDFVKREGYVVNNRFSGHGIGKEMHEGSPVMSYYIPNLAQNGTPFQAGKMYCLEPQITYKDQRGIPDENMWTFRTSDGRKSAFFEHQVLVKEKGIDILTKHFTEWDN
jgi:methionyl aminopeptidase